MLERHPPVAAVLRFLPLVSQEALQLPARDEFPSRQLQGCTLYHSQALKAASALAKLHLER